MDSLSFSQFCLSIKMSTVRLEPLMHLYRREIPSFCFQTSKKIKQDRLNSSKLFFNGGSFCTFKPHRSHAVTARINETVLMDISEASEVSFNEKFPLKRTEIVEGKISVRLDRGKDEENWQLTVGCNLPGKWVLHWGVTYVDSVRSGEWDQPPPEMRPPGSIAIKDYAIESLLKKSSSAIEGRSLHEVQITCNCNSLVAAINFVLKDEETGSWYQHRGRDFRVALMDCVQEEGNLVGGKKGLSIWSGAFHQISSIFLKAEGSQTKCLENGGQSKDPKRHRGHLKAFYEEYPILKEILFQHVLSVSVRKLPEKNENLVHLETDLPGEIIVHWGVCRDKSRRWEIPAAPHPPETKIFNKKALRTLLKPRGDGCGSWGLFSLDKEIVGLVFVLNLNDNTWLNCMGSDFYIPLQWKQYASSSPSVEGSESSLADTSGKTVEGNEVVTFTDVVTKFISNLIGGIFSGNSRKTKSKEAHENILQESEKLAEEAYNSFRSSSPALSVEAILDADTFKFPVKIRQGTGSGYEILCQGFNWESHKSRRWYMELNEKTTELSSLGFTMVWLPPPTESVSPEGYMPKDLYNLNSRYGSMEELKILVKRFHEVGIKVLGDVVLNHRCAHYRNQNGVWNIFGGRLNWDDCAVVVDDPHFQGRGNKSSGDHFHAAPNIDHSQDFVRKDLKEWLCWLRKEIGYDGWRLDFVRGFWGGYVKDYLDASEPYFSVGEYWDSLSYTYGEMDPNQDAHRQRIIDWINATNGAAGAFDVTTKGILHAALERCEYWRLSDQKGKPPGVMGWWPSCAVTFIENHDTGSTQGHWRFPGGKEMQGYAYILTHPGTPAVFYDHVFSHYQSEISALISLRHRTKIHCRSTVKIIKAERDVYAAIIDGKVAMKIGPGYYEPPSASHGWVMAVEGRNYKVWEAS